MTAEFTITEEQKQIMAGKICPYCRKSSVYTTSLEIYGKDYGMIYLCAPCKAWVGTHNSRPTEALGRLANAALRKAKGMAHTAFDSLWREHGFKRAQAYRWLAHRLDLPEEYCHIGMMSERTCKRVIELVNNKIEELKA